MARETYDWSTHYTDEQSGRTTTFTSSTSDTVNVRVRQTDPNGYYRADRDGFETSTAMGGNNSGYFEMGVDFPNRTATVTTRIDFSNNSASLSNSVRDPSFTLFDVDSTSTRTFQDMVTVRAWDAAGNLLTVTMTAVDPSVVTVVGGVATAVPGAGSGASGSVDATSTQGNVLVSIIGEVARIDIIYGNGPLVQANPAAQAIGFGDLSFDLQPAVICFARGTRIRAMNGEIPVEALSVGDMVKTADNGFQAVRWIGSRRVSGRGEMAPVRFAKGAIGNRRPLSVSPRHKVVMGGWKAQLWFGEDEVLAQAIHLVNGTSVVQVPQAVVEYFHVLLDHHEVIYAEGAPCESLSGGKLALDAMGVSARAAMAAVLEDHDGDGCALLARANLRAFETRLLA